MDDVVLLSSRKEVVLDFGYQVFEILVVDIRRLIDQMVVFSIWAYVVMVVASVFYLFPILRKHPNLGILNSIAVDNYYIVSGRGLISDTYQIS